MITDFTSCGELQFLVTCPFFVILAVQLPVVERCTNTVPKVYQYWKKSDKWTQSDFCFFISYLARWALMKNTILESMRTLFHFRLDTLVIGCILGGINFAPLKSMSTARHTHNVEVAKFQNCLSLWLWLELLIMKTATLQLRPLHVPMLCIGEERFNMKSR